MRSIANAVFGSNRTAGSNPALSAFAKPVSARHCNATPGGDVFFGTVECAKPCAKTGEYPQNVAQGPGLGFPIARIGAIFSPACGAIVDLGICRYAGKGQGELSVFRNGKSLSS